MPIPLGFGLLHVWEIEILKEPWRLLSFLHLTELVPCGLLWPARLLLLFEIPCSEKLSACGYR